jgi:hypothetical protein
MPPITEALNGVFAERNAGTNAFAPGGVTAARALER